MATTRLILTPESAYFPASAFAIFGQDATTLRPSLKFIGATTSYVAQWQFVAWQGISGTLTAVIYHWSATGSNTVNWVVAVDSVTPENSETMASQTFDSNNTATSATVVANGLHATSVTLTNTDSITAGDLVTIKVSRDVADSHNNDVYVNAVEIREA